MDFELPKPRVWYRRWWGVAVIFFGSIFAIFLILVIATTARYWWQLRNGQEPAFIQDRYSSFTTSSTLQTAATKKIADRQALETMDDPYLGRPTAPVVIVAFFDYKCPNCRLAAPILRRVAESFGYGVKIIIRDLPVETLHPGATTLAYAANCADKQERFWPMFDLLFNQQDSIGETPTDDDVRQLAQIVGVDAEKLLVCMKSDEIKKEVSQDYVDGARFGVAGTPTFFISGERVEGVVPFEAWKKYLESVIQK